MPSSCLAVLEMISDTVRSRGGACRQGDRGRRGALHGRDGHSRLSTCERRLVETTDEVGDPAQSRAQGHRGGSKPTGRCQSDLLELP